MLALCWVAVHGQLNIRVNYCTFSDDLHLKHECVFNFNISHNDTRFSEADLGCIDRKHARFQKQSGWDIEKGLSHYMLGTVFP